MAAVQETIDQVRMIDVDQYKYGFETIIEMDKAPKGLSRRHHSLHFGQEGRAGVDAGVAPGGLSPLADAGRADLGARRTTRRSTSRTSTTTRRRRSTPGPTSLDEVDPELLQDLREARHSAARAGNPRRRAKAGVRRDDRLDGERQRLQVGPRRGRCRVRFRVRRHDLQGGADEGRRDLLLDLGSDPRASRAGAEISRHGRAGHRQLLCDAEFGRLHRRFVRLRAEGRSLPDGAVDLFPHQREEHRPVRAHADHRGRGRLRLLSRRLHRAAARREPASRRRGRTGRAGRCRDQVFDGPELVSGRHATARAASTTSSPSAAIAAATARRFRGRRSRPVRRSPGNTRPASCAATTAAASSIRSRCRTATSRSTAAPR